jgi:hypothetical protein
MAKDCEIQIYNKYPVIEPSDAERADWLGATEQYVADLECIIRVLAEKNAKLKEEKDYLAMLMQDIRNATNSQKEQGLLDLRAENAKLKAELEEWRNAEASICPEDVGFVEYIATLKGATMLEESEEALFNEINELRAENAKLKKAVRFALRRGIMTEAVCNRLQAAAESRDDE